MNTGELVVSAKTDPETEFLILKTVDMVPNSTVEELFRLTYEVETRGDWQLWCIHLLYSLLPQPSGPVCLLVQLLIQPTRLLLVHRPQQLPEFLLYQLWLCATFGFISDSSCAAEWEKATKFTDKRCHKIAETVPGEVAIPPLHTQ